MNTTRKLLAVSAAFLLGSGAAFAQEAASDNWTKINTSATYETVRAEAQAAQKAGNVAHGEATRHGVIPAQMSPASRAQVQAEAREALRLGLVAKGEGPAREATAQELQAVKTAGLRAAGELMARSN
jgi:hypothetical protein